MKAAVRLFLVVLAGVPCLSGCGRRTDLGPTDLVFNLSRAASTPDGRPVVDVQPNGRRRPPGTGPSGSYFLMVRKNGAAYHTRWFYPHEAATGFRRDPAAPTLGLEPEDELTVAVENLDPRRPSDFVRFSNALTIPPPPPEARSFAIPPPDAPR